jgi:hypothetical protein
MNNMAVEKTSTWTGTKISVGERKTGDDITANTFIEMVDILEELASHTHIFYDDYSTVCQCQCQCGGGRGVV